MKLVLMIIMATYVASQAVDSPILADNQVLREFLVLGKETCNDDPSFAKAKNLINNEGNLVFVTSTKRILKADISTFNDNTVVFNALTEASANPGVAKKQSSKSEWNDGQSPVKAKVQMAVAATSGEKYLDYYFFQYDLNLQGTQGKFDSTPEQYLAALSYLACVNTNEWIQNYAATKST
jgi:hypothetical protein